MPFPFRCEHSHCRETPFEAGPFVSFFAVLVSAQLVGRCSSPLKFLEKPRFIGCMSREKSGKTPFLTRIPPRVFPIHHPKLIALIYIHISRGQVMMSKHKRAWHWRYPFLSRDPFTFLLSSNCPWRGNKPGPEFKERPHSRRSRSYGQAEKILEEESVALASRKGAGCGRGLRPHDRQESSKLQCQLNGCDPR